MNRYGVAGLFVLAVSLLTACKEDLDTMAPGSANGKYALGVNALVPLAVGNRWTYTVILYDTSGEERGRYSYVLTVLDTVIADTSRIPLIPPSTDRSGLPRKALSWYLLEGESGVTTCWQIDSVEYLRVRRSDDTLFYEQSAFNYRAAYGDTTTPVYVGSDTVTWASGDRFIYDADSVASTLISKGSDTLRTTLGSSQYFQYREMYGERTEYTDYYFKPGFGLVLKEIFQRTPGERMVRVRRDELATYYLR